MTPKPDTTKETTPRMMHHSASITSVADFASEAPEPCKNVSPHSPFESEYNNLASRSEGAKILFATDDWFAAAENLLKDGPPIFDETAYCEQGKVMDGWETRRKREEGHDWCLIHLSSRAKLHVLELDTAHFTGNHVPKVSLEIADLTTCQLTALAKQIPNAMERMLHGGVQGTGHTPQEVLHALDAIQQVEWKELLATTPLNPGFETSRMSYKVLEHPEVGTLVRLNYFPDGGVARLQLWGESMGELKHPRKPPYMPIQTGDICTVVKHSSTDMPPSRLDYEYPELSSQDLGGDGLACSNKHYGEPWRLTQKSLGKDMGDGWETARHPCRPAVLIKDPNTQLIDSPLMDWAVLKLGQTAKEGVARVILDTKHFRGNYPESVQLEGCCDADGAGNAEWFPLVARVRMSPDAEHVFERSKNQLLNATKPVSHVRLTMFPDGGLSRVRVYG